MIYHTCVFRYRQIFRKVCATNRAMFLQNTNNAPQIESSSTKQTTLSMKINMSEDAAAVVKLVLSLHSLGSISDSNGYSISKESCGGTILPFIRHVVTKVTL